MYNLPQLKHYKVILNNNKKTCKLAKICTNHHHPTSYPSASQISFARSFML